MYLPSRGCLPDCKSTAQSKFVKTLIIRPVINIPDSAKQAPVEYSGDTVLAPFFEVAIIIAQTTAKVYRFDINFFQNIFLHNRKIKLLFILKYIRIECDPLRAERCQSGLMCPLGKRVYRKVSEVRILSSPPNVKKRMFLGKKC